MFLYNLYLSVPNPFVMSSSQNHNHNAEELDSKCSSCHNPCKNNPNYKGDDCLCRHSRPKSRNNRHKTRKSKSSSKNSEKGSSSDLKTLYNEFLRCVEKFEDINKTNMEQHSKSSVRYGKLLRSKDTYDEKVKEHNKARILKEKLVNSAIHKIFSQSNSDEDACEASFKADDAILLESKSRQEMVEAGKEREKAIKSFDEAYELDNQLLEIYHRIGDTMYDAFKAFIECVVANISTNTELSRKQVTSDHFINVLNEHSISIEGLSVETHILKGGQKRLYVSCGHCFRMETL